jgi:outer membrane protein assembly factor BamD
MNKIFSFFFCIILLASCSQYQKALKSDDVAVKTEAANKMFETGKYLKAIRLYEQVAPAYKGKPQAERLFFMYSKSLYNTKQYYLAGYQFENFSASYPKSEKREEASFLASECFYLGSN